MVKGGYLNSPVVSLGQGSQRVSKGRKGSQRVSKGLKGSQRVSKGLKGFFN